MHGYKDTWVSAWQSGSRHLWEYDCRILRTNFMCEALASRNYDALLNLAGMLWEGSEESVYKNNRLRRLLQLLFFTEETVEQLLAVLYLGLARRKECWRMESSEHWSSLGGGHRTALWAESGCFWMIKQNPPRFRLRLWWCKFLSKPWSLDFCCCCYCLNIPEPTTKSCRATSSTSLSSWGQRGPVTSVLWFLWHDWLAVKWGDSGVTWRLWIITF